MIESGKRVFLSLDDTLSDNYDTIWPGYMFENSYADSDKLAEMESFNDEQVIKFNTAATNQSALFKISWTLTTQGDTIAKSILPQKPHSLMV